jgi:hypothetical protein
MSVKSVDDVEHIKELIKAEELKAAKAQGVIDTITEKWAKEYGKGTLANARDALDGLNEKIKAQSEKRDILIKELDDLYDWDSLEG